MHRTLRWIIPVSVDWLLKILTWKSQSFLIVQEIIALITIHILLCIFHVDMAVSET